MGPLFLFLYIALASLTAHAEPTEPAPLPDGLHLNAPFPKGVEYRAEPTDGHGLNLRMTAHESGRGLPVTTAAAGQVVYVGWGSGSMAFHGRLVVIWHGEFDGGAIVSVYGHLGESFVETGDWVLLRQELGRLGGSSRGREDFVSPRLYFALFQGGSFESGELSGRPVLPDPLDGQRNRLLVVDDNSEGFELSVPRTKLRSHSGGFGPRGAHLSMPGRQRMPAEVWARWVPKISQAGAYRVQVFVPQSVGSTAQAWYRVFHLGGEDACPIDQHEHRGEWVALCEGRSFEARSGRSFWVELNDVTGSKQEGRVALDAVRFEEVGD